MKVKIILARLVREEKTVTVEAPDDFMSWDSDKKIEFMEQVYQDDDGNGFSPDESWGCEEGTHYLVGSG